MQTLLEKVKKDTAIMKVLKVSQIRYHIANTNLGSLDLGLNFGEEAYQFFLDANPLEEDSNNKLLRLFDLN